MDYYSSTRFNNKNIIRSRLSDIYKNEKIIKPDNVRDNFNNRFAEYANSYPDLDLTVVIPAYNCEDLIAESIESVLKISDIKFNIIIIDDGSNDNTQTICQYYAGNILM
ncbi:glycosyltransferase family 2 protein [Escherichia coli]|uniref:glycosyltransferase family 2 protein n=1 Tax=Escherichia coli TaxID=562 RepID=UPI002DDC0481|nr:glycosyltransferase [Escherichia coli]